MAAAVLIVLASGLGGVGLAADSLSSTLSKASPTKHRAQQESAVVAKTYGKPKYKQHTTPHHTNLNQGQSGNFTTTLVPKNGYTGAVTCTAHIVRNKGGGNLSQYPTVNPPSQPAPVPGNVQWTVSTTSTTQPGQYTLKVICSDGTITRRDTSTFRVS